MTRNVAIIVASAACFILLSVSPPSWSDAPPETLRPVTLEVHLPSNAVLAIAGETTASTGGTRLFRSPPIAGGRDFTYELKAVWNGKEIVRNVTVRADQFLVVDFNKDFTAAATPTNDQAGQTTGPRLKPGSYPKPGFVTFEEDGRLWVFKEKSKDLDAFRKDGELAKHVIRVGAGPKGMTLKAPDVETMVAYVTTQPGFVTMMEDGRLWIFKAGSKDLEQYQKDGELAKHVTRIAAGPLGLTVKAPDAATIEEYSKLFHGAGKASE